MKVFISWSGKPSLQVATVLKDWLKDLFNGVDFFLSSEDIRKGKQWPLVISKELETTDFGIVCLTSENLQSPWIVFEAGALSKFIEKSSVFTVLLGGLKPSDVDGPLSHFQHTAFDKADFYRLIQDIDATQGKLKREDARLLKIFDAFWPELVKKVDEALKNHVEPKKGRSLEDMVRELLDVTNSIAKNLPQEENLLERLKRYSSTYPGVLESLKWVTPPKTSEKAAPKFEDFLNILEIYNPEVANALLNVQTYFDVDEHRLLFIIEKSDTETDQLLHKHFDILTAALQRLVKTKGWRIDIGRKVVGRG